MGKMGDFARFVDSWSGCMEKKKNENDNSHIRQVSLSNLNQSVLLVSTYRNEDMDFLICRALKVLQELKEIEKK